MTPCEGSNAQQADRDGLRQRAWDKTDSAVARSRKQARAMREAEARELDLIRGEQARLRAEAAARRSAA